MTDDPKPPRLVDRVRAYLRNHTQMTLGGIGAVVVGVDFTPYEQDFQKLLGGHFWHTLFRLLLCAGIMWRAYKAGQPRT